MAAPDPAGREPDGSIATNGVRLVAAVLWQHRDGGAERCRLERMGQGWRLNGVVLLAVAGIPVETRYVVTTDSRWRTEAAHVVVIEPERTRRLHLIREAGGWELNGAPRPDLIECVDVDLGFTPATNTLPIRRLQLGVGEAVEISAAWVGLPELGVIADRQRYRRLGDDGYEFRSGDFRSDLRVDPEGLVLSYEEWTAIAHVKAPP